MSDRLTPEREAEIAARWEHIPANEQPRIAVTNSSRGGSLLNALGHARHDVPALLAELAAVRAERDLAQRKVASLKVEQDRDDAEYAAVIAERDSAREALREACDQIAALESDLGGATARIAELTAERHTTNEDLDDAVRELRSRRDDKPAATCRCNEPDADPYACEADDCEGEFSELNPFGGGPVQGVDAKVSKTCGCGWRTSVWHVNDGSAEEELHRHVTRRHEGATTQTAEEAS